MEQMHGYILKEGILMWSLFRKNIESTKSDFIQMKTMPSTFGTPNDDCVAQVRPVFFSTAKIVWFHMNDDNRIHHSRDISPIIVRRLDLVENTTHILFVKNKSMHPYYVRMCTDSPAQNCTFQSAHAIILQMFIFWRYSGVGSTNKAHMDMIYVYECRKNCHS